MLLKLNYLYNIIGNSISKFLPILLGLYFSRYHSDFFYYQFVDFLIEGNLLVSIAVMGFGSQLLIANNSNVFLKKVVKISLLTLACVVIFYLLFKYFTEDFDLKSISVAMFALGTGCAGLSVFYLNGRLKHNVVFIAWCIFLFCTSTIFYIAHFFNATPFLLYAVYGTCFLIFGIVISLLFLKKLWYSDASESMEIDNLRTVKIVKDALFLSSSTAFYLIGFKIISSGVESDTANNAVFSLGYQLFALALFIPSISGSFFIPYLSLGMFSKSKGSLLLIFYFLISICVFLIGYFMFDFIVDLYGIIILKDTKLIYTLFLVTSILASLTVFFVQKFNSTKKYGVLALSSFLWLLVVVACNYFYNQQITSLLAVKFVFIAYLTSLFFLTFKFIRLWKEM